MASIINIETSTKTCSVSLAKEGVSVFENVEYTSSSHAKNIGVFVQQTVGFAKNNGLKIDAVAVSGGPGSYTGLRIGVSEAKGLCYGLNIPLIALPTLKVLAASLVASDAFQSEGFEGLFCPMIDARRMEVYAALYDMRMNELRPVQADIVDEYAYSEFLSDNRVVFFGDGAAKCRPVITSPNAVFVDDIHPLASAMAALAESAYHQHAFVDVAYYEPFYLKEFQATVAKNKVF